MVAFHQHSQYMMIYNLESSTKLDGNTSSEKVGMRDKAFA